MTQVYTMKFARGVYALHAHYKAPILSYKVFLVKRARGGQENVCALRASIAAAGKVPCQKAEILHFGLQPKKGFRLGMSPNPLKFQFFQVPGGVYKFFARGKLGELRSYVKNQIREGSYKPVF